MSRPIPTPTPRLDETHDPELRSWVASAGDDTTDFPLQNLPYGVFRRPDDRPRVGVAIGAEVLDLSAALAARMIEGPAAEACDGETLNDLMALPPEAWADLRRQLSGLLRAGSAQAPTARSRPTDLLAPAARVELLVPAHVGDYTDFYASRDHARNVGSLFRPDQPLLPNYAWVPIGYHGRASSVVASGAPVRRPSGQRRGPSDPAPTFGPTRMLDYELEVGCWVGGGNPLGTPIPIDRAERHVFGLCLLNDWSARDVQAWEYQPLGPFLGKSFATTVSPWVVTWDALAPFRTLAPPRGPDDPAPLPYLDAGPDAAHAVDLALEVHLATRAMRAQGDGAALVSRSNLRGLFWTFPQMVAHHTSNGCNLRPGDLLGSGTVSGPEPEARGCLLERTARGAEPFALPGGEHRAFLEDGDEVILTGRATRAGFRSIGFGACRGVVV